jgi:GNAT superfamily N-acetyltransferase
MQIREILQIGPDIQTLATVASEQGFGSVRRLVDEHLSGDNRFDLDGEVLFGVYADQTIVGIGGLNVDPYESGRRIGRLRRFYVKPELRRYGVGTKLLRRIEERANGQFPSLQLFAPSEAAGKFYESFGYTRQFRHKVSHAKSLMG